MLAWVSAGSSPGAPAQGTPGSNWPCGITLRVVAAVAGADAGAEDAGRGHEGATLMCRGLLLRDETTAERAAARKPIRALPRTAQVALGHVFG